MRKTLTILLILPFVFFSCKFEKKYSDYNETDFYEVQGIIDNITPNRNPFDSPRLKNVKYTYFLDRSIPKKGIEKNLDMMEINNGFYFKSIENGYPIIIFIHKNDENISFCGPIGTLDSLNSKEKEFLTKHFKHKLEMVKKETPDYINKALIKGE
ncbi:hypothetical protein [Tamlana sp. I1]|uniref:hypothetical protein n=1 Tax=Tamlana sp. I1 TaxID=2762061 RepID=UPI001E3860CC|nr:hypothetical protein [Tamlana sp. I1]